MISETILAELLAAVGAKQTVALVTVVTARGKFAGKSGHKVIVWPGKVVLDALDLGELTPTVVAGVQQALNHHRSQLLTYLDGDLEIFVEVQQRPPTLLIIGAGHVAQPLAQLGKMINFQVVVLDDRPQYANRGRFPGADRVIAAPFVETLRHWSFDDSTYVVLVTRGHSHDVACLLEILDSPVRYIGMIGSKRRVKSVFDLLEKEQDIPREKLNRVYAPVGLDIGAETPAEIGICVIAEIINLYRGGRAQSLSDALRTDRRLAIHPGKGRRMNENKEGQRKRT